MQTQEYSDIPRDFADWLAGFIDGEGFFVIAHNRRLGTYCCRFGIGLRDDDAEILHEIRDTLGCGRIRFWGPSPNTKYGHLDAKPGVQWLIESRPECLHLIELLDHHPLRAKKKRDYAIWREAVEVWMQIRPTSGPRGREGNMPLWDQMGELKDALSEGRVYRAGSAK